MADYQLRARIPHELADEVKGIVEELNEVLPEAEATMSTVSRFALKEYVRQYKIKHKKRGIILEIPTSDLTISGAKAIHEALDIISKVFPSKDLEERKELLKGDIQMLELQEIIAKKKAEQSKGLDS